MRNEYRECCSKCCVLSRRRGISSSKDRGTRRQQHKCRHCHRRLENVIIPLPGGVGESSLRACFERRRYIQLPSTVRSRFDTNSAFPFSFPFTAPGSKTPPPSLPLRSRAFPTYGNPRVAPVLGGLVVVLPIGPTPTVRRSRSSASLLSPLSNDVQCATKYVGVRGMCNRMAWEYCNCSKSLRRFFG